MQERMYNKKHKYQRCHKEGIQQQNVIRILFLFNNQHGIMEKSIWSVSLLNFPEILGVKDKVGWAVVCMYSCLCAESVGFSLHMLASLISKGITVIFQTDPKIQAICQLEAKINTSSIIKNFWFQYPLAHICQFYFEPQYPTNFYMFSIFVCRLPP